MIRQIAIGDATLEVEQTGQGADLLLISGAFGPRAFFDNQVAAFAERFRVTRYDHRGIGGSSPIEGLATIAQLAADVPRLLDALGIARAHVLGHSTGAAIAQHVALDAPERVERLVLSGAWAGPTPYFVEGLELRRLVLEQVGPVAYFHLSAIVSMPSAAMQAGFDAAGSAESFFAGRAAAFVSVANEVGRIRTVQGHDLRARVAGIRAPTLVLGAMDDQMMPPGMAEELAGLIPGARLERLERGGHFCVATAAEAYNAAVLGFLTELVERAPT